MECICEKGIGKTHAKWSPVCTAWYRMLPDIRLTQKVKGDEAKELVKLCPAKVFDIEDLGSKGCQAVVKNQEACTTCRECIRHEHLAEKVSLGKRKDVFEFHVESVGMYSPQDIVVRSLQILKEKAQKWKNIVQEKSQQDEEKL